MKYIKFILIFLIFSNLFFTKATAQNSELEINPQTYDWGAIKQDEKAELNVDIKNTTNNEITINSISTSCMCTTAVFISLSGEQSPEFGMHGNKEWQVTLKPNEAGKLHIIFDPQAHNVVGPTQRSVYIKTNLSNKSQEISLKANVYVKGISEEIAKTHWDAKKVLPVILSSGFLDGINPCAIGVLLLFIAFLFTIRRTKANIFLMGGIYILAIFLAYLGIGLGLFKAIVFSGYPNIIGKIAAYLIIVLGVINIIDYFRPNKPPTLAIPSFSKHTLKHWMEKATLPTAFIFGFLVGLCTFPCSGGIYVAIIGLLASTETKTSGFIYLLIYNFMFVMPLIILLLASANKIVVNKITKFEKSKARSMRLISGLIMILLSVIILIWFV